MLQSIETYYPLNETLKKYVYCYYIVDEDDDNFKSIHYSFPHVYNAVSFYFNKNEHTQLHLDNKAFPESQKSNIFTLLQGKRLYPLKVELNGAVKRITILFKSLGLNNFITKPLNTILKSHTVIFNEWNNKNHENEIINIFKQGNKLKSIELLEQLLLTRLNVLKTNCIEKALDYLSDFDEELSIEAIALKCNMSVRNFNRIFNTYLGISPIKYKQIAKFRHTLESEVFNNSFNRMVDLAYNNNYYDQAYFNKLFKQLTGSNPKLFFNSIDTINDTSLVFQFIDKKIG